MKDCVFYKILIVNMVRPKRLQFMLEIYKLLLFYNEKLNLKIKKLGLTE